MESALKFWDRAAIIFVLCAAAYVFAHVGEAFEKARYDAHQSEITRLFVEELK